MSRLISEAELTAFHQNGYVILKGVLDTPSLDAWEKAIIRTYAFQALKIDEIRERLSKGTNPLDYDTVEDLDQLILLFEDLDKKAGFHASALARNTLAGKQMALTPEMCSLASAMLDCPEEFIFVPPQSPSFFIKLPAKVATSNRLLYGWHSEVSYYPKRRSFLTYWFPLFRSKRIDNGTMYVCPGSHTQHYPFAEYRGDGKNTKDAYWQLETPEYELTGYEKIPVQADRGDLVIIKDNIMHRSSPNETDVISYGSAIRVFDYAKDLTLSHELNGELYSRPGILPVDFPIMSKV